MKTKIKNITLFIIALCCIVLQVRADLKIPEYMSQITTYVQTSNVDFSLIVNCGLKMLACSVCGLIAAIIVIYCSAIVSASVGKSFRKTVFNKVLEFNHEEIEKFSTSSLLTRTVRDVGVLQMIVILGLQTFIKAPLIFFFAIDKISDMSSAWTRIIVYIVVGLVIILALLMSLASPRFKKIQDAVDSLSRVTRESLNGIRVVRAYNAETYQQKKFENLNNTLLKHGLFADRIMSFMNPLLSSVLSGVSIVVYWSGAYIIQSAAAHEKLEIFSNMMVYSSYALQIISAFLMMGSLLIMSPKAIVHIKRVAEVIKTKPHMIDGSLELDSIENISFQNVSFSYPEQKLDVLRNITFDIQKGETVAIVGATGSGKSSLANLILRLYDVTSGEILINNKNIQEYTAASIRSQIGYISQKAILFSGNIADNVTCGKPYQKVQMKKTLQLAQASEFVERLEDAEFSNVAQNGANYSGGQKQRLSIARALYKNPDVLIFDDSFSALDFQTDAKLRAELNKQLTATKIIVAQRIGTIKDADKIIVLHEGEIVGIGKHEELIKNNQFYQEIVYSQLEEGEI